MYQKKTTGGIKKTQSKFKASLADRATQRGPVSKEDGKRVEKKRRMVWGGEEMERGREMKEKESEKPDHNHCCLT